MQALEEGQKFERYLVLRTLGSSVAGVSYKAQDTRQQRTVVLKPLHSWAPLPDAARRQFFRDIQAISRVVHPHIVPILNYGEWHGQLFVARTYVEYGSLLNDPGRNWFRPPFDAAIAIAYSVQIADTLSYIHNIGYAHGSLTFSNLLIERGLEDKQPFKLADSGLSAFIRRMGQPQMKFLPITAAPEQLDGQTGQATPASDQYALAVLLYFWLTGRPPFLGSPDEIGQLKRQESMPSPLPFNATISYALEYTLRRAMSAHPKNRFANIQEFAQALQNTQVTSNQDPTPPMPTVPNTEPIRRVEPETSPIHPELQPPQPLPAIKPQPDKPAQEPLPAGPRIPAPDIAQPIPDATPFAPPEIKPQSSLSTQPEPETAPQKPSAQNSLLDAEPLPASQLKTLFKPGYLSITPPITAEPFTYSLSQPTTSLGRAGSSDILLDQDETTSRHHALIRQEGQHAVLYDCSSTHGISVNGHQLVPDQGHILLDGDQILIGNYTLLFFEARPIKLQTQQEAHAIL